MSSSCEAHHEHHDMTNFTLAGRKFTIFALGNVHCAQNLFIMHQLCMKQNIKPCHP